jgi:hypothetical protein
VRFGGLPLPNSGHGQRLSVTLLESLEAFGGTPGPMLASGAARQHRGGVYVPTCNNVTHLQWLSERPVTRNRQSLARACA